MGGRLAGVVEGEADVAVLAARRERARQTATAAGGAQDVCRDMRV